MRKDDGEVQVAALIYTMVCYAENIFKSCTFDDDAQQKDYDAVLGKGIRALRAKMVPFGIGISFHIL